MNKTAVFFAAGLALLAGCVKDDLSWRALLNVEKQKQEELAEKVEGLQKSNTPFMLVMVDVPQDTVSKGMDFASLFRVNPSGVQLTKEMIALDCVSSKQFFPVQSQSSSTKASYVTPSEHFSIKELAVDKNAVGEPREGQYLATLTTSSEEIVWDDSRMAFVGAYVDHEGKTQCVSSDVFQTVMMPLPHEGMDLWMYPHASLIIKENQKDTLGSVYLPLDSKTFQMKGGGETRRYTSDMLFEASFALDEGCTAPVTLKFDDKRHFLRFTPDTTGNETWRALQDTTVLKRQDVTGILSLKDRWGGESSLHLKMSWYNVRQLALEYPTSGTGAYIQFTCSLGTERKFLGTCHSEVNLTYANPRVLPHFHLHVLGGIITQCADSGILLDVGEILIINAATAGHRFSLLQLVGIQVLDLCDTFKVGRNLADIRCVFVHRSNVHTDGTEDAGSIVNDTSISPTLHQGRSVVNVIVVVSKFLQVGMVVVGSHTGMRSVDTFIYPRVRIHRIIRNHIAHGTHVWLRSSDALF